MKQMITEKVGYWIDSAIAKHGQGENILWEPSILPGPQGSAIYTVFVWFPGTVLGSVFNGSFQLPDALGCTESDVDKLVGDMLEEFRGARSQMLAEAVQNAPVPPRGAQTPSGLLIP